VENVAHGAETDHKQTELGLRVQTLIFSQGAGRGGERQLGEKIVQRFVWVVNLDGEAGGLEGKAEGDGAKPDLVFLRGQEGGCTGGSGARGEAGEVAFGVAMVVGEGGLGCEAEACSFEASEELLRAGDAAEGGDWAVDGGNVHGAAKAPDWASPTPGFQFRFQLGIVRGNGKNGGAMDGAERLAKIACGEKAIVTVAPVEEQDVGIAVELAVLEAVVEEMGLRAVLA
jgi:hypothetical protein